MATRNQNLVVEAAIQQTRRRQMIEAYNQGLITEAQLQNEFSQPDLRRFLPRGGYAPAELEPTPGEASMRSYTPTLGERLVATLAGTNYGRPTPERRAVAEGIRDLIPGSRVPEMYRAASRGDAQELAREAIATAGQVAPFIPIGGATRAMQTTALPRMRTVGSQRAGASGEYGPFGWEYGRPVEAVSGPPQRLRLTREPTPNVRSTPSRASVMEGEGGITADQIAMRRALEAQRQAAQEAELARMAGEGGLPGELSRQQIGQRGYGAVAREMDKIAAEQLGPFGQRQTAREAGANRNAAWESMTPEQQRRAIGLPPREDPFGTLGTEGRGIERTPQQISQIGQGAVERTVGDIIREQEIARYNQMARDRLRQPVSAREAGEARNTDWAGKLNLERRSALGLPAQTEEELRALELARMAGEGPTPVSNYIPADVRSYRPTFVHIPGEKVRSPVQAEVARMPTGSRELVPVGEARAVSPSQNDVINLAWEAIQRPKAPSIDDLLAARGGGGAPPVMPPISPAAPGSIGPGGNSILPLMAGAGLGAGIAGLGVSLLDRGQQPPGRTQAAPRREEGPSKITDRAVRLVPIVSDDGTITGVGPVDLLERPAAASASAPATGAAAPVARTARTVSREPAELPMPPQLPEWLAAERAIEAQRDRARQRWEIYNESGNAADFVRADEEQQKLPRNSGGRTQKPDSVHKALEIIHHLISNR